MRTTDPVKPQSGCSDALILEWTYEPKRVRVAPQQSVGPRAGVDRRALPKVIHEARQQDSPGHGSDPEGREPAIRTVTLAEGRPYLTAGWALPTSGSDRPGRRWLPSARDLMSARTRSGVRMGITWTGILSST